MNVLILATRNCSHCKNFHKTLDELGIEHEVHFVEDKPDLMEKYNIRHSPNMVVDEEVIFRKLPTEQELKQFFKL
ncbi:MAG: thioredoxin family protein [Gammaproteobacteria bacterium]